MLLVASGCGGQGDGDDTAQPVAITTSTTAAVTTTTTSTEAPTSAVVWELTAEDWQPINGTPPPCPDPLVLTTPVDLSKATSILYPGQSRPDYKPHGAFRFDGTPNDDIDVVAPISGVMVRGARYLVGEASGDPAYASAHGIELDQHAVCWFDLLASEDAATVRSLPPGDPNAGATSDYCT